MLLSYNRNFELYRQTKHTITHRVGVGKLTDLHNPSKHRCVVHRAAVPPPLPELVLALLDARLGSVPDVDHVVLVQLAQLPLALQTQRQRRRRLVEISTLMV